MNALPGALDVRRDGASTECDARAASAHRLDDKVGERGSGGEGDEPAARRGAEHRRTHPGAAKAGDDAAEVVAVGRQPAVVVDDDQVEAAWRVGK